MSSSSDAIQVCIAGAEGALARLLDEDRSIRERRQDYRALRKHLKNAYDFASDLYPLDPELVSGDHQ